MSVVRLPIGAALALLLFVSCSARESPPTPLPTRTTAVADETAAPAPTDTPASSTELPTPRSGSAAALEALVLAQIPESALRVDDDGFFGFDGVKVFPLDEILYEAEGTPWGVVTIGSPGDDPFVPHFVAVYQSRGQEWEFVDRIELPDALQIFENSVSVVDLEPTRYWIEVHSTVGVHGGYYEILSYDGASLRSEVSGFSAQPGAGQAHDVDGDGILEVLLNANDPYIFCYACGVIDFHTDIYRWEGGRMSLVQLEIVGYDDDTPADDSVLANNAAVELAVAYRWTEAAAIVDAHDLKFEDGTIRWNAYYISFNAESDRSFIEESAFPFLQYVFVGDFEGAYAVLQRNPPTQTFVSEPAFFAGTPAEGFGDIVASEVLEVTERARFSEPERASIVALHAWALFLLDPSDGHSLEQLQDALALAPADPYLAAALELLASQLAP